MKYLSHEAIVREAASGVIPAEELSALATEMRRLWHRISRGDRPQQHADRQQFWVLGALECGPKRMSSLAEIAETSQASLTGIVDRLEDRGLVERCRSIEDRRVVHVTLTDAGRSELFAGRVAFVSRLETVLSPLDAEERADFLALMRKITGPVTESPAGPCA